MTYLPPISYPFVQAAHYKPGRLEVPRLIVCHDMEVIEKATAAEAVQAYFHRKDSREASTHLCADSNSVVRCVLDSDTAYGAKGANSIGLHIEHAGYARQTPAEWLDPFGIAMLGLSSIATASWCRTYSIPPVRLTPGQIRAGASGFCGHGDVTAAFPPGTGHTDPGPSFPWDYYLGLVRAHLAPAPVPAPQPEPMEDDMPVIAITESHKHWLTDLFTEKVPVTNANEAMLLKAGVRKVAVTDAYMATLPTRLA